MPESPPSMLHRTAAKSETPCHFFSIPRELRDHIYSYLTKDYVGLQPSKGKAMVDLRNGPVTDAFLVSRQFKAEYEECLDLIPSKLIYLSRDPQTPNPPALHGSSLANVHFIELTAVLQCYCDLWADVDLWPEDGFLSVGDFQIERRLGWVQRTLAHLQHVQAVTVQLAMDRKHWRNAEDWYKNDYCFGQIVHAVQRLKNRERLVLEVHRINADDGWDPGMLSKDTLYARRSGMAEWEIFEAGADSRETLEYLVDLQRPMRFDGSEESCWKEVE